jgi:DNA-binding Lrp family transcriptional regulator
MKRSDLIFLSFLRQDARQTLTAISRRTKIPISTLYDKLRQHEKDLILKHTTLIDFSKLGYNCRAKIMLVGQKDERERLRSYLSEHRNINSLYKINNGFDFLAEGIFQNVKELEDFLEQMEASFTINEKKIFYVIEDLKRECFLSRPDQLAQVLASAVGLR